MLSAFLGCCLLLAAVNLFAAAPVPLKDKEELKGVVLLDSITYPILIPSEKYSVVLLVANKAQVGDYGTDSIRQDYFSFAQFSQMEGEAPEILFAQMFVNGAENLRLATSLGLKKDFKHPVMFIIPKGSSEPIQYPSSSPFHIPELVRFLGANTNFYYKYPGTIRNFDDIANELVAANTEEEQKAIVQKAEKLLDSVTKEEDKETSQYYVKTMKRIVEKGTGYISAELTRIENVMGDKKTSNAAKDKLKQHGNVLKAFQQALKKQEKGKAVDEETSKTVEL